MLQNATWIVEYSASNQDFKIQELAKTLDDNIISGLEGMFKDYQLIGIFPTKKTASIFCEGYKSRLSSMVAQQTKVPAQVKHVTQLTLNYRKAVELIRSEVTTQPRGFVKRMCQQANLTYHTVIGLINDTLPFEAVDMVSDVLVALGYQVKVTRVMVSLANSNKRYQEEITYLIRKENPSANFI